MALVLFDIGRFSETSGGVAPASKTIFCRTALGALKERATTASAAHPPLVHMLVLPKNETIRIPVLGGHPIGFGASKPPRLFKFGGWDVATELPPKSCWPKDLGPLRAIPVEQEFAPYQPLAIEPYRVHLFFGDAAGMQDFHDHCREIVNLAADLRRAVFGDKSDALHDGIIYSAGDCIHDEETEILDRWLCTVHWWAWKTTDSPIFTKPKVIFSRTAIDADFTDKAVAEKLSISVIPQDVFAITTATINTLLRFLDTPPDALLSSTYPPSPAHPITNAPQPPKELPTTANDPSPLNRPAIVTIGRVRRVNPRKANNTHLWRKSLQRIQDRFAEASKQEHRLGCMLIQSIVPTYPRIVRFPQTAMSQGKEPVASGGGLHKEPRQLLNADGSPMVGERPIADAYGRPMVFSSGEPIAIQPGVLRITQYFGEIAASKAYSTIAVDAAKCLDGFPVDVNLVLWKYWLDGFDHPGDLCLWTNALFELAWQSPAGTLLSTEKFAWSETSSYRLDDLPQLRKELPGIAAEIPDPPVHFYSTLDDLFQVSVAAIDFLLSVAANESPKKNQAETGPQTGSMPFSLPPGVTHTVTMTTEFLPTPAPDDPKGLRDAADYCRTRASAIGDARAKWWWAQATAYDDAATKAEEGKPVNQNPLADFIIVTALEEERDALLARLPGYRKLPPKNDDVRVYYEADLTATLPDKSRCDYRAIVVPLIGMGRVDAAVATADAIRRWRPRYVILAGIAGGIASRGVKLGDILVSDQVVDFELQKIDSDGTSDIRWEVHRADPRLLGAAINFPIESCLELVSIERPEAGTLIRHIGPIATGDKVIANEKALSHQADVWKKLIGIEMEAGGAAKAAFQSAVNPGFFMVRAVSDFADKDKNRPETNRWRHYSCAVAASYLVALLKTGPIPPRMQ